MPSANFAAPYDRTTKILSAVVCVFLLSLAAVIQNVIVAIVSILVIALAYAYSPRGYTIADRSVLIKRPIGNVRVPLDDVREARPASSDDYSGCIRLWGSGGLFGYYGLFRTDKLGRCTWYATDRSRAVVLITAAKTALFSPDDVEGFLAAIRRQAPVSGVIATLATVAAPRRPFPVAAVLAPALGLAGFCVAILAMRYDPGPPDYTLTGDSLAIHDRFYPVTIGAGSTDTEGIRAVDLDQETGWQPVLRVGGFANSHYQSGWYRAANGIRVRLYRQRGVQRLVLLPPKKGEAPLLLQVALPGEFAEQLRNQWHKP
ncbi:MAG TPA: PH domain-containing protein [Bryobacteraceae bacterium]|nr:PH domain-containing protein [Bryobacteraceae bacterium]